MIALVQKLLVKQKRPPLARCEQVGACVTCRSAELQRKNSEQYSVCGCSELQLRYVYS